MEHVASEVMCSLGSQKTLCHTIFNLMLSSFGFLEDFMQSAELQCIFIGQLSADLYNYEHIVM